MMKQSDISCDNGMLDQCHGDHIVQHMAFRFVRCTKKGYHFARLHDNLTKQQRSRSDNICDHLDKATQSVNLREIPATGSKGFPNMGSSIQTDDINIMVAKVEDVFGHVIQDNQIGVVEVPLVWIGRSSPLYQPRCTRKSSQVPLSGRPRELFFHICSGYSGCHRRSGSSDIPDFLYVPALFTHVPHWYVFMTRSRKTDHVEAGSCQVQEILHRAQFRLDTAKTADSISTVTVVFGAFYQRHEVQIIDATALNIIKTTGHDVLCFGKGMTYMSMPTA